MSETQLEAIMNRLNRLEQQNRRLKRIGACVLPVLLVVVVGGWQRPTVPQPVGTVIPEGVQIYDREKNVRAAIFVDREKNTSTFLLKAAPKEGDAEDAPKPQLVLGIRSDGEPYIDAVGKDGKRLLVLELVRQLQKDAGSTNDTSPGDAPNEPTP